MTTRDIYRELQGLKGEFNKLKISVAVVAFAIFGQYAGLGDAVSQAMPFHK